MNLKSKFYITFVKFIKDGSPEINNFLITIFNHLFSCGWKRIEVFPDRGAQKAGDHITAHVFCGPGSADHFVGCPLFYLIGLPFYLIRHKCISPLIPVISDTLPGKMSTQSKAFQVILFENVQFFPDIVHVF